MFESRCLLSRLLLVLLFISTHLLNTTRGQPGFDFGGFGGFGDFFFGPTPLPPPPPLNTASPPPRTQAPRPLSPTPPALSPPLSGLFGGVTINPIPSSSPPVPLPSDGSCLVINGLNRHPNLTFSAQVFSQPGIIDLVTNPDLEPITVLAPTNRAWDLLFLALQPQGWTRERFFSPENGNALMMVARYLILKGKWTVADFNQLGRGPQGEPPEDPSYMYELPTLLIDQPIMVFKGPNGAPGFVATSRQIATLHTATDQLPCPGAASIVQGISAVLTPDPNWQGTMEEEEAMMQVVAMASARLDWDFPEEAYGPELIEP
jgi:hypothetical protein